MAENAPSGKGMKATLTKKVGGVPVWAWAAVGSAGVAFFLWKRNKSSAASTTNPATAANSTSPIIVPTGTVGTTPPPTPVVGPTNHPKDVPSGPKTPAIVPPTYVGIVDPVAFGALIADGVQTFWRPTPGNYIPWKQGDPTNVPHFMQDTTPQWGVVGHAAQGYDAFKGGEKPPTNVPPGGSGGVTSVNNTPISTGNGSPASALSPFAQTLVAPSGGSQ